MERLFRDGRTAAPFMEETIAFTFDDWKRVPGNKDHDVVDDIERKWEVRCMTTGISFAPSNTMGAGREFSEEALLEKLKAIEGYLICDVFKFPKVDVYPVSAERVHDLWNNYQLGANARIDRKRFFQMNLFSPEMMVS